MAMPELTAPPELPSSKSSSRNPLTALSSLETEKKYTLVFLLSVGTTLLLTGASGGRLLKRAKKTAAGSSSTPASHIVLEKAPATAPVAPKPIPRPPFSHSFNGQINKTLPPLPLFADPQSLTPPKNLLRTFKRTSPTSPSSTSYFLPNSTLISASNSFATQLDAEDKLHKDGETQQELDKMREQMADDGFNPAVFAAKAFGIATVLTVSVFAVGLFGIMAWYQVEDLESLSLALSHSLPKKLDAHRPTFPKWIAPSEKAAAVPGEEEENAEHKEGVAYWLTVKETLDREAEEMKAERRKAWEKLKGKV